MAMKITAQSKIVTQGFTRIKLFAEQTASLEKIEETVNKFLLDNVDSIIVKDIKYTAASPNPNNSAWKNWTVMVIYETK